VPRGVGGSIDAITETEPKGTAMTDLSHYADTPVLKAKDVNPPLILTIDRVEIRKYDNGDESPVFHFAETKKYLPGGTKENLRSIFEIAGSTEAADLIGQRVVLYSKPGRNPQGTPMDVVRVRSVEEQEAIDAVEAARKAKKAAATAPAATKPTPQRLANDEPVDDMAEFNDSIEDFLDPDKK
jgi:hypothetical protein